MGVPIRRSRVYWGLFRGPLILGNYHIVTLETRINSNNDRTTLPSCTGTPWARARPLAPAARWFKGLRDEDWVAALELRLGCNISEGLKCGFPYREGLGVWGFRV